jgi:hypothetical protein
MGTAAIVAVLVLALGVLCSVTVLRTAADGLHAELRTANGDVVVARPHAAWLAARLAADVPEHDAWLRELRGRELDHRAERLTETAAAVTLIGVLLALVTARPQSVSAPLAKTSSNGSV